MTLLDYPVPLCIATWPLRITVLVVIILLSVVLGICRTPVWSYHKYIHIHSEVYISTVLYLLEYITTRYSIQPSIPVHHTNMYACIFPTVSHVIGLLTHRRVKLCETFMRLCGNVELNPLVSCSLCLLHLSLLLCMSTSMTAFT